MSILVRHARHPACLVRVVMELDKNKIQYERKAAPQGISELHFKKQFSYIWKPAILSWVKLIHQMSAHQQGSWNTELKKMENAEWRAGHRVW